MLKLIKRLKKEEHGQALIMVVLTLTILISFVALIVDVGRISVAKVEMQNAADAAALAGAKELPNASAKTIAENYAITLNGADEATATTPYLNPSTNILDRNKIEVVSSKVVPYTFAKIFGLEQANVSARAVAQNDAQWNGETLPFVNMLSPISGQINVWDKVDSGVFESIDKYEVEYNSGFFHIDYYDGIKAKKGKVGEGTDDIKSNLAKMWAAYTANPKIDKYIYIFSFSEKVFDQHYVETDNGLRSFEDAYKHAYPTIGQNDTILLSQLVLIECTWDSYSEQDKSIAVTYHATYDLGNDVAVGYTDYPDFPVGKDGSSSVGSVVLVE